ncbi:zinc-dependent alcohol dehydrogenase family protein [Paractinoplanes lichenicola]|uniref:NAD(P)-dependent alcohol dehydrogenase n=1 Tax=Paractinoplanes lichenicola TaxID=2802976 RepID=A0ABS1VM90_9ACTN|nr:NAD(P)-dependent alcohol dehydrogenase [Actinoplanes lichenicola]MBL7255848.1 NAD(P)-dependent alcohol dehydrogenase [Actinoplanes lichenicola]
MRKWVLQPGVLGLDALSLIDDADVPEPGPGQVRVAVRAASVNYRDQIIINGEYGQTIATPTIPLSDASGVIDAVGPDVYGWKLGDRVISVYFDGWVDGPPTGGMGFGLGAPGEDGVLAEYIVLDADRVAAMPASLDFAQAATLTCAGLTAWTALFEEHPVTADQTVLTLGTGGVAIFAVQLARAMGAKVLATTSREEKVDRLTELGAAQVFNYRTDPAWGQSVAAAGGADKVVNAAGGGALAQSVFAVNPGGEIAVMGLFSGGDEPPALPVLMAKGASIRGTAVGGSAALNRLGAFIDAHGIKPVVQHTYAFTDARAAYAAQAGRDVFGKIVIETA